MLKDLVVRNRSYRGFDESRRLTREELLELVDLTRYTASGANIQPLKYRIIWEKEVVDTIQPLTKWGMKLPKLHLPLPGTRPTAFIVVCQDMHISSHPTMFITEQGIAAQTILLAAVEKGLGGCLIQGFKPEEIKTALHLAENLEPRLIIALGKPAEEIHIVPVGEDGSTAYYRDENNVHYVPKRALEDIVIE